MKQLKKQTIIDSIYEMLISNYQMIHKHPIQSDSMENMVLKELNELKTILSIEETLFFTHAFSHLRADLPSKEKQLERGFIYTHLVFLFSKKMLYYPEWLLCLVCDSVTTKNVSNHVYLKLISDHKWMMKIFEHAMLVDYSSSVSNYKIDQERIKRIFLFLCRRIDDSLKNITETEISRIKKEVLKIVKSYQTSQLFKRSVT